MGLSDGADDAVTGGYGDGTQDPEPAAAPRVELSSSAQGAGDAAQSSGLVPALVPAHPAGLARAIDALVGAVEAVRLPLDVPGAERARGIQREVAQVLDDAVLRRLRAPRGPLLVVVGGGTGVGKSTLVNSVVREVVSPGGVLRPTTRDAVVVCHPSEVGALGWWGDVGGGHVGGAGWSGRGDGLGGGVGGRVGDAGGLGPGDARGSVGAWPAAAGGASRSLFFPRPLPHPSLPLGIALVDTPDINSVVVDNQEVGARWMAAADVVVFVTSAARYADAAPWRFLQRAGASGVPLAVVVDRVAVEAVGEVRAACSALLAVNGLGAAPLFVVCEGDVVDGLLPVDAVLPLVEWLRGAGAEPAGRERIGSAAVAGRWRVLAGRVEELGAAADVQMQAVDSLQQAVERVYTAERVRFRGGLEDGELFGGEVLIRWQELVGSEHVSMLMGTAAPVGRRAAGVERAVDGPLREALVTAVGQAVRVALDRAARRTAEEWELILGAPLVMHGAATVSEHGTSAVGQHGRSTAEERGAGTAEQETRRAADGTDRHAIVGTRAATEARAAAANWLDRLPGAIRDQARARRASRAAVGPGARGAALLLGVAAVAGRTDSTEPSAAAAHGLVRALFGPDDAARLLAVARIGLRDAGAALLERSADGCRAHIAGYGLTQRLPDELREALSEVRKKL